MFLDRMHLQFREEKTNANDERDVNHQKKSDMMGYLGRAMTVIVYLAPLGVRIKAVLDIFDASGDIESVAAGSEPRKIFKTQPRQNGGEGYPPWHPPPHPTSPIPSTRTLSRPHPHPPP